MTQEIADMKMLTENIEVNKHQRLEDEVIRSLGKIGSTENFI